MNKKGFTLIELLAVISLVALLVIITMPNIIKYTNSAKEEAFLAESNSIYESVLEDVLKEIIDSDIKNGLYCKTDSESQKLLSLSSAKNLNYKILVEDKKIVYFHIDNGTYSVLLKNYKDGIKKTDIKDVNNNYIPVNDCFEPSKTDSSYINNGYTEEIKTIITGYTCEHASTVTSTAEKYFTFDVSTRTITNYSVEGPKQVVIPCQIAGVNVKAIASNAFEKKEITSVVMPNTILSIGNNAFNSNKITKINLSNSLETIGAGAFSNNQITEIVLPNSLISIASSSSSINGAFENNKLTSVTFGNNIQSIGAKAFAGSNEYNKISVLKFTSTSNLNNIGNEAFLNNNIKSLIISNNKKVSIGKSAFKNNKIITLDITSSTLTFGDEAFTDNIIAEMNLNSKITSIGLHAFRNNQLPDEQAFIMNKDKNGKDTNVLNSYGGYNRNNIIMPEYVNTIAADAFTGLALTGTLNTGNGLVSVGNNVFASNLLEKVIIGDAATKIGIGSFANNLITSLTIGKKLLNINVNAFNSNKISNLKFNDVIETIDSGAFYNNNLTKLNFPDSLKAINYSSGKGAFENNKLTSVTFGKNIDTIGSYAFTGNVGYNRITTLDMNKSQKLLLIGRDAFANNLITEVTLPKSLKNLTWGCTTSSYGCGAFRDNRLTKVIINSESLSIGNNSFANNLIEQLEFNGKIISMGIHAFHNNQVPDEQAFIMNKDKNGKDTGVLNSYAGANRNNITIPGNVKSIASGVFDNLGITGTLNTGDGLVNIDSKAFASNMFNKVIIGNGAKTIGKNAFYNNQISSLTLSNNLETIGAGAFYGNKLTSIVFPDTLKTIESSGSGYNGAFENNKLMSVKFGSNITHIGSRAFIGKSGYNEITNLDITASNKLETIGVDTFASNKITSLVLPSSLKEISLGCTNKGIACGAFRNNRITNLTINSKSLSLGECVFTNNLIEELNINGKIVAMGQNAFRNNQLPDNQAFIMNVDSNGNKTSDLNSYAGANRSNITIPSNVKNIDSKVFNGLALTGTLNTGNGLVSIGESAFENNSLKKVIIGDSAEVLEANAFNKNRITELVIGKNLKTIKQGVFYSNKIEKVSFNNKIEYIAAGAFYVNNITELTLPDSLKTIDDPAPNVHGAFESNNLKKVTFGKGIEKIGDRAFSSDVGNNNIETIDLSSASSLKSIGETAFYGNNLSNVIIPENVSEIDNNAFVGNNNLSKIFIRNKVNASNFSLLGNGWNGSCDNIIYELSTCYTYNENTISDYSTSCGTDVVIPKKIGGKTITTIAANAFNNKGLTSITLPSTITSVGSSAFANNSKLSSIVMLGKYSESNFTSLDKNWNIDNTTVIYEKNQSTCLKIEGTTVTGYYYDTGNCNKDIIIPSSITAIAPNAFSDHVYDSITIKDGTRITSFGKNWNGTIYKVNFEGDSYEYNCFTLDGDKIVSYKNICSTTVDLTSGKIQNVTIKSIAPNAFKDMGVNVIKLSSDITSIGESAFEGNDISSVYLKEGLESIGVRAFYNTGITSIALPSSLKSIGEDAFSGNENLLKIILYGKTSLTSFDNLGKNWNGTCKKIEFQN